MLVQRIIVRVMVVWVIGLILWGANRSYVSIREKNADVEDQASSDSITYSSATPSGESDWEKDERYSNYSKSDPRYSDYNRSWHGQNNDYDSASDISERALEYEAKDAAGEDTLNKYGGSTSRSSRSTYGAGY